MLKAINPWVIQYQAQHSPLLLEEGSGWLFPTPPPLTLRDLLWSKVLGLHMHPKASWLL